jgi:hypothetical protein
MGAKAYAFEPNAVRRPRGGVGKRGDLAGLALDRGFVQFSWSSGGATGDKPSPLPHDQMNYVEVGEMGFNVNGVEHVVRPGQVIYIPAGASRQGWSITDTYKVEVFGSRWLERWEFADHQLRNESAEWKGRQTEPRRSSK